MEEYIGLEWNAKLEQALHRDHIKAIARFRAEDTIRKVKSNKPLGSLTNSMIESMVVAVLKSRTDPEIVGLGKNYASDLFTDNWGQFLASFIQGPTVGTVGYPIKLTSGSLYLTEVNYGSYNSQYGGWWNESNGSSSGISGLQFQFGSGSTAPARSDYVIQTPFVTAPENAPFDCGIANYANGYVTVANSIAAGGSGTINEVAGIYTGKIRG